MRKTLTWLGSTTAVTLAHGPLLTLLVILAAVLLTAGVVAFLAAVFFTDPCANLVALIRAWRHGP